MVVGLGDLEVQSIAVRVDFWVDEAEVNFLAKSIGFRSKKNT